MERFSSAAFHLLPSDVDEIVGRSRKVVVRRVADDGGGTSRDVIVPLQVL